MNPAMIDASKTDIFISYRRVDGRDYARNIQLALGKEGFQNVFFDYNSMRDGMFNEQILTAISNCKDFILVLSPQSMIRCANQDDWVAREIQAAIDSGCKIIPVQINEPFTNWPSDFPRKFNFIKQIEFLTLRTDEYFDASIQRLVSWLDSKPTKAAPQASPNRFTLEVTADETCELQINGQKVRKIKAGSKAFIDAALKPGKTYELTFVSLASKAAPYTIEYTCSDIVFSDTLEVSFAEQRERQKMAEKMEKERKEAEAYRQKQHQMMLDQACSQYDSSWYEEDGMVAVMKDGKIGFLNENCFEVIPCVYENTSHFSGGYATACRNGKWGIIDRFGQEVVPFRSELPCYGNGGYDYFVCSLNDRFAVSSIAEGFPNVFPYDDVIAIKDHPELFFVKQQEDWKMINAGGGDVPYKDQVAGFRECYTPLSRLCYSVKCWTLDFCELPLGVIHTQTGKVGYLNSRFEMTIPFADEWSGEQTYLTDYVIIMSNGKMGLANAETGRSVLPPIYDNIRQFDAEEPLFRISDNGSCSRYIVRKDGMRSDNAEFMIGGMQGVVNLDGEMVVPQVYQQITLYMRGDRANGDTFTPYLVAEKLIGLKMSYSSDGPGVYTDHSGILRGDSVRHVLRWEFDRSASIIDVYSAKGDLVKRFKYDDYKPL